jgi:hypothetical protein
MALALVKAKRCISTPTRALKCGILHTIFHRRFLGDTSSTAPTFYDLLAGEGYERCWSWA